MINKKKLIALLLATTTADYAVANKGVSTKVAFARLAAQSPRQQVITVIESLGFKAGDLSDDLLEELENGLLDVTGLLNSGGRYIPDSSAKNKLKVTADSPTISGSVNSDNWTQQFLDRTDEVLHDATKSVQAWVPLNIFLSDDVRRAFFFRGFDLSNSVHIKSLMTSFISEVGVQAKRLREAGHSRKLTAPSVETAWSDFKKNIDEAIRKGQLNTSISDFEAALLSNIAAPSDLPNFHRAISVGDQVDPEGVNRVLQSTIVSGAKESSEKLIGIYGSPFFNLSPSHPNYIHLSGLVKKSHLINENMVFRYFKYMQTIGLNGSPMRKFIEDSYKAAKLTKNPEQAMADDEFLSALYEAANDSDELYAFVNYVIEALD